MREFVQAAACSALLAGCSPAGDAPPRPEAAPPAVDTARVRLADAVSWRHRRSVEADLDGDGTADRVVLTSDVDVRSDGTPLWEDGHRWAVVIEDGDARTLVYGAFVPNGHAEAAIVRGEAAGRLHVLVLERTPQRSRTFVVAYEGPERTRAVSTASESIAQWLPSLVAR